MSPIFLVSRQWFSLQKIFFEYFLCCQEESLSACVAVKDIDCRINEPNLDKFSCNWSLNLVLVVLTLSGFRCLCFVSSSG